MYTYFIVKLVIPKKTATYVVTQAIYNFKIQR